MASGHVNRIKRPNTWLHRPMLQNREESSCQHGAVHTWHETDLQRCPTWVRSQGQSGLYVLGASISLQARNNLHNQNPIALTSFERW